MKKEGTIISDSAGIQDQTKVTREGKCYIGTKVVRGIPMSHEVWLRSQNKWNENQETLGEGYLVEYEDGYKSWSPKSVFERCYREVTLKEHLLQSLYLNPNQKP